jgi:hypothetical protein
MVKLFTDFKIDKGRVIEYVVNEWAYSPSYTPLVIRADPTDLETWKAMRVDRRATHDRNLTAIKDVGGLGTVFVFGILWFLFSDAEPLLWLLLVVCPALLPLGIAYLYARKQTEALKNRWGNAILHLISKYGIDASEERVCLDEANLSRLDYYRYILLPKE